MKYDIFRSNNWKCPWKSDTKSSRFFVNKLNQKLSIWNRVEKFHAERPTLYGPFSKRVRERVACEDDRKQTLWKGRRSSGDGQSVGSFRWTRCFFPMCVQVLRWFSSFAVTFSSMPFKDVMYWKGLAYWIRERFSRNIVNHVNAAIQLAEKTLVRTLHVNGKTQLKMLYVCFTVNN